MARPAEATALRTLAAGTADLHEIQSRIRSRRTEGHFYVALLGLRSYEPLALHRQVQKGLGYSAVGRFQRNTGLPAVAISRLIQVPARTLTRRRSEGKLTPEESDRLVRAARLFGRAMELLDGDAGAARAWLMAPQPALGGLVPLELAGSEVGAAEVEGLIGRLEYGIPS